jgi:phosphonate transport system ATP-binding protein
VNGHGQLQRAGIARVLYQSPELILADEPVSAMDPVLADHTLSLLNEETSRRGITLPPVCMRWTWP